MIESKKARQRGILAELDKRPALRIGELARSLGVSSETIRRDLDELTERGLVGRTYGGAVRPRASEPSLNERHALLVPEREAIARAAVARLGGPSRVIMGSGATTVHVARRLAVEAADLTVITHSFGIATVLSLNPTVPVLMAPGVYHSGEGAMTGAATVTFLSRYRADWAILGASGLTEEGPADALIASADVFEAIVARAERRMVVADASKFDKRFAARWAGWDEIDCLVTDRRPEGRLAEALAAFDVEVLSAETEERPAGPV